VPVVDQLDGVEAVAAEPAHIVSPVIVDHGRAGTPDRGRGVRHVCPGRPIEVVTDRPSASTS
jgi:hypothetical protein